VMSHWFAQLPPAKYDLIVSNPPYVAEGDAHLGQGDLRYEPATALVAGADGLDDIRHIVTAAPGWLRSGGLLMLEHGHDQGESVRRLFGDEGYIKIQTCQDYGQRERFTMGYWTS